MSQTTPGNGSLPSVYERFVQHASTHATFSDIHIADLVRRGASGVVAICADKDFRFVEYAHAGHAQVIEFKDESVVLKLCASPVREDRKSPIVEITMFAHHLFSFSGNSYEIYSIALESKLNGSMRYYIAAEDEAADTLIIQVCNWARSPREEVWVFDKVWHKDHDLWLSIQFASWDDIILSERLKQRLLYDIKSFFDMLAPAAAQQNYREVGVVRKRGILLQGCPGSGKKSTIQALMKDMKLPVLYVTSYDTPSGDGAGIRAVFQKARQQAPCALIMEHIDDMITPTNRNVFLTELDDLRRNDGILLIATTDHADRLDAAITQRQSRFDRKHTFGVPDEEQRKRYVVYWSNKVGSFQFSERLIEETIKSTVGFSFAYLKEALVSSLLLFSGAPSIERQGHLDEASVDLFEKILQLQISKLRKQSDDIMNLLIEGYEDVNNALYT